MWPRPQRLVEGRVTCCWFLGLLALSFACALGFQLRPAWIHNPAWAPDGYIRGCPPCCALCFFGGMGAADRGLYALTQVTLDLAFPVAYAGLFAIALRWAYGERFGSLVWVPFLAALADLTENALLVYMALNFDPARLGLARAINLVTQAKWLLVLTSAALVVIGLAVRLWRRRDRGATDRVSVPTTPQPVA